MTWQPPKGGPGTVRVTKGHRRPRVPRLAVAWGRLWSRRESFLLAAGVVLPRATGLLTLPIYTRLLGPEDFGRYELLIAIVALLYAVCLLGLDFAISVRYYGRGEPERRRDIASALGAAATASVFACIILIGIAGLIGPILLQSPGGGLPFAIAVAAVPFNALAGVLAMFLRLRFQGRAFFRAMVGGAVGGTVSGLVLVVAANWGLIGAVVGLATMHLITFALLVLAVGGLADPRAARVQTASDLIRLGAPLIPAGAASWIFALADRFFVAAFLGFTQLGLYAAAARLATLLALIQFGFHAAWGPVALHWGAMADRDRRYAASLQLVAIAGGAAVAIVSWLARPLLGLLAGPAYVGAADVVWLLTSSVLFSAMFFVVQIGANLGEKGGPVASALVVAALINTAGNLTLIPILGYVGAGLATLTAYVCAYVIMYVMGRSVTPLRMGFGPATVWATAWTAVAASSVVAPGSLRPLADVLVIAIAAGIGVVAVAKTLAMTAGGPDPGLGVRDIPSDGAG